MKKLYKSPIDDKCYIYWIIGNKSEYSLTLYITPLILLFLINFYNIWLICTVKKRLKELINPNRHETYNIISYLVLIVILYTSILNWITSSFRFTFFIMGSYYHDYIYTRNKWLIYIEHTFDIFQQSFISLIFVI